MQPVNLGLPGKMAIKVMYVGVGVTLCMIISNSNNNSNNQISIAPYASYRGAGK